MPASKFSQKEVGVMTRVVDVIHHYCALNLAGVVDDDVAKTQKTLRNACGNSDVLDFTERNISRGTGNETSVDFKFGVGQSVANCVAPNVVVGRNQQQRQGHRD